MAEGCPTGLPAHVTRGRYDNPNKPYAIVDYICQSVTKSWASVPFPTPTFLNCEQFCKLLKFLNDFIPMWEYIKNMIFINN